MKKIITFIFILLIVVAGYFVYQKFYQPRVVMINNFEECVAAGNPVMESYPRQCRVGNQTFTEDIGNKLEKENLIQVARPGVLELVENPITIEGQARGFWFFEASFPVKLIDVNGKILGTGVAQAKSDWMTEDFVPFQAELKYAAEEDGSGRLILMRDNPSGLPENDDSLEIPVRYQKTNEKMKVKVYFQNPELDVATDYECNKVLGAEREVEKTVTPARVALEELLKGPTETEKELGFITNINAGVLIQKLTIEKETAKVDFNAELERAVGGSCRVAAIRAQITETLKQFESVKNVIISIDGRTEDILQP